MALGTNDAGERLRRLARRRARRRIDADDGADRQRARALGRRRSRCSTRGPYPSEHGALERGADAGVRAYPNMRVFDWAREARDAWFIDDGIHYNTPGYARRARLIAPGARARLPGEGPQRGLHRALRALREPGARRVNTGAGQTKRPRIREAFGSSGGTIRSH